MRKRLIVLIVAVLALGLLAASASADQAFNNTCGQNGNPLPPPHTVGIDTANASWTGFGYQGVDANGVPRWAVTFVTNCGTGGTLEWEIQHLSGSWGDVHEWNGGDIDHQVSSPVTGDNSWLKTPGSLNFCAHGDKYRVRFIWTNEAGGTVNLLYPSANGASYC